MNYIMPAVSWTDDRIELLKASHIEGLTALQIAARLGGTTRNAVIGKMHRLGMNADMYLTEGEKAEKFARQAKAKELREARKAERKHRARSDSPEKSKRSTLYQMFVTRPADDMAATAKHIPFLDLEPHHCRFPYGTDAQTGYTFCGHDKIEGSTYCAGHHALCWVPPRQRFESKPAFRAWT